MKINISFKKNYKKDQYLKIKNILQCMIKKGHKATIESVFKDMLFYMAKNKKTYPDNPWYIVVKGIYNITPQIDLKSIKIRRKVIYKLKFMTAKKQSYLVYHWLVNGMKKNNYNFYQNLAQELKEASVQKGSAFNQRNDFYKFIENNIFIYKKN